MKIFDPHLRSRSQGEDDLRNLHYFGTEAVVIVAYGHRSFEDAGELNKEFAYLINEEWSRLQRCGFTTKVALGINPQSRPRRSFPETFTKLVELASHERVCALGEIGVWEDREEQWELFERQIEVALECPELPLLLVPPKKLKRTFTYKMLDRLEKSGVSLDRVAVSGVDQALVMNVIESKAHAIIPVGAGQNDPRDCADWVGETLGKFGGENQILFTAGLKAQGGDVLAIPKAVDAMEKAGFEKEIIQRLVCENGRKLFRFSLG